MPKCAVLQVPEGGRHLEMDGVPENTLRKFRVTIIKRANHARHEVVRSFRKERAE